ncbi:lasso peptide biosynthesis PqqD family chaperone [Kibdelosporangium aridum]|uniref:lasso peptide biosynthesis PqqD family chaperone n=1 Tax=Kibdelosporangium aridum TaxID=2030 RepID=UPI0035E8C643
MLELREDVSLTDTDYGTVLLDERSGEYWMLNPTAALVLRTLLAGGTSEDAANQLATEFDVDPATQYRTSTCSWTNSVRLVWSDNPPTHTKTALPQPQRGRGDRSQLVERRSHDHAGNCGPPTRFGSCLPSDHRQPGRARGTPTGHPTASPHPHRTPLGPATGSSRHL